MESSNSGSFQTSSSGDDGEFDSRFLNIVPPPPHPPPPPPSSTASSSSFFDPLSPYLASFPFAPAPPPPPLNSLDLDFSWSKAIQQPPSLPTCTAPASAASRSSPAASTSHAARPRAPAAQTGLATAVAPRGSRKRSRASRRAPTTVLATDTSNFRAMVQQFTGFPAPPFASSTSSAPFLRPRLDPFNIASSSGGAAFSSYLLRPFSQKILSAATAASFPSITTSAAPSTSSPAIHPIASMARTAPPDANAPAANNSSCCATSIFSAQNPKQFDLQGTNFFSQSQLLQSPKYSSQSLAAFGARQHHQSSPNSAMGGDLGSFIAAEAMKSSTNWADETRIVQDQNEDQRRSKD